MQVIEDNPKGSQVESSDLTAAAAPLTPIRPLPRLSGAPYPIASPNDEAFAATR